MTSKQVLELAPDQIAKLPSKDIPSLVEASIQLDRDIKTLSDTLSSYKERLVHEAETDARAAGIAQPGTTWNYNSPQGEAAQVAFPLESLVKGGIFFMGNDACRYKDKLIVKLGPLKQLAGRHWDKLFSQLWKPAKAFRELAGALLDKSDAQKLIAACTEPASPRVSFKTTAP